MTVAELIEELKEFNPDLKVNAEYGVVGFSPDGAVRLFVDAKTAVKELGIGIHRMYECLKEGNDCDGWTFDYAIEEHLEDAER